MPSFSCDLTGPTAPLTHAWEHTIGSGHAPLALRADWQAQLAACHRDLGVRHVRFHGLLSDDMGTLICHREQPLYSFFNADRVWDFLLSIGMRPFVELSFMPEMLASGHTTVFHYRGNITQPITLDAWATLIAKLAQHWVDRYGAAEVARWFFEVWNEPNLPAFWSGTRDDYFAFYRATAAAIKGVDAALRVGGPATADGAWIEEFLAFCRAQGAPADFVSTHFYPTDALGAIGQDTESQLAASPRDAMLEQARTSRQQAGALPLYYTEWCSSSNPRDPLHDEPYAAAFAARTALQVDPLVQGYSWWTFSDVFEENYFPSVPFHGGFGLLNLHGIPKPTYRAFELLHRLGDELLPATGSHETVDAWFARKGDAVTALVTNHALPRHPVATEVVALRFAGGRRPLAARVERVDDDHANPVRLWHAMGDPEYPKPADVEALRAASALVAEPLPWTTAGDGAVEVSVAVPPHGVAAVTLELAPAAAGSPA